MKSVFVGGNDIIRVYGEENTRILENEFGLDSTILSKEDVLSGKAVDSEYIFSTWGMPQFSVDEIKQYLPNVKAVFYSAGSVQSFAHEFIEAGVKVFSAWGANAVPVAEYTVAQIILANKGFYQLSRRITNRGAHYKAYDLFHTYCGNYDCNIGIIGAGMIGKLVINMLKPYRLKVKVFDPFLPDEKAEELGVEKSSLEEIFSTCQTISNHLANNAQTVGMLNYSLFSKMMPNATFINTGRGAQIVEADLVKALEEQPDRTAVLDVTMPEPPEEDSPLYTTPNVFLTPHIAGSAGNEVRRMSEFMIDEARLFTNGQPTRYEVTKEMLKTMA